MKYKEFIKPGNKVVYLPENYISGWFNETLPQVVTIGEFRPYYTDGTPDPTPDEYDETCYVEIEEDINGDSQIPLRKLYPIIPEKDERYVIVDGKSCRMIGFVDCDDEDYSVVDFEEEERVVDITEWQEMRSISDLSFDELIGLRKEICIGSIYLADYKNSYGIDENECCGEAEAFAEYIDWDDELATPENFAHYFYDGSIPGYEK